MVHLDIAIHSADLPFIKEKFNPVEKRRTLYIGHTAWYKNTSLLESLVERLPKKYFFWM